MGGKDQSNNDRATPGVVAYRDHLVRRGSSCHCRVLLAEAIKEQALWRKRAQKLIKKGGHPFEHSIKGGQDGTT